MCRMVHVVLQRKTWRLNSTWKNTTNIKYCTTTLRSWCFFIELISELRELVRSSKPAWITSRFWISGILGKWGFTVILIKKLAGRLYNHWNVIQLTFCIQWCADACITLCWYSTLYVHMYICTYEGSSCNFIWPTLML